MEENKKKKNIALGVTIAIIVILAIALGIGMYFLNNLKAEVESKNDEISKLNQNINVLSEQIVNYNKNEEVTNTENDSDTTGNGEKEEASTEELDDLSIAIQVFSDYLDGYKIGGKEQVADEARIKSYTFKRVELITDEQLNELDVDSENRIVVHFTYDVELYNLVNEDNSLWTAGNGVAEGNWVKNKSEYVFIKQEGNNYKFEYTCTAL